MLHLSGFCQKSMAERIAIAAEWTALAPDDVTMAAEGLAMAQGDKMIENVFGRCCLPPGIGANFLINGCDFLIPKVVEEPSVVAAVNYVAKLARTSGGFLSSSTQPVTIAQVQLLDVPFPRKLASH